MKLRTAINNKDYSTFKKSNESSFSNYYDELAAEIYPDTGCISDDHYESVEASGRVEKYAIREWLCTDTHVGLYLYVVDGAPVCLSHQQGRKCYPEWSFLSKAAWNTVRQLFDDHRPAETNHRISLVDDDLMELYVDADLFDGDISNIEMGLSPLMRYTAVIDKIKDAECDEGALTMLQGLIDEHDDFMQNIASSFSEKDFTRAQSRAKPTYDMAMALLNQWV
jgi:hypothetical protein